MTATHIYVLEPTPNNWAGYAITNIVTGADFSQVRFSGLDFYILMGYVGRKDIQHSAVFYAKHPTTEYADILPEYFQGGLIAQKLKITAALVPLNVSSLIYTTAVEGESTYLDVAKQDYQTFCQVKSDLPHVVLLEHNGSPEQISELETLTHLVRAAMDIPDSIKVIPCNVKEKSEVQTVLLTLLDEIGDYPGKENMRQLVKEL